jgi:ribonuclease D
MMTTRQITKDEINLLPPLQYGGEIVLAASPELIERCLEEIAQSRLVGFDTESKPSFRKGEFNHVALVQVATEEKVYILRILKTGLTESLVRFLSDPGMLKVGIAIDDDLHVLRKRRHFQPAGFADLNKIAPQLGFQNIGVRNLAALVLGGRISKSQQRSNWDSMPLTEAQLRYAATDAWVCLRIYNKWLESGELRVK